MKLKSPEFENNQFIPDKFTCEGEDINPELFIEGLPTGARSLALIVEDPDSIKGNWVHWVVYNIAPVTRIGENSIPGKEGINDFGRKSYGGPCPLSGTHRYLFRLYALDAILDLKEGLTKFELERSIENRVLARAELIGLYQKKNKNK